MWPDCYFLKKDLYPLERTYPFGFLKLWGPRKAVTYLDSCYGKKGNWRKVGYHGKNHETYKTLEDGDAKSLSSLSAGPAKPRGPLKERVKELIIAEDAKSDAAAGAAADASSSSAADSSVDVPPPPPPVKEEKPKPKPKTKTKAKAKAKAKPKEEVVPDEASIAAAPAPAAPSAPAAPPIASQMKAHLAQVGAAAAQFFDPNDHLHQSA
eukprot:TRINITY_DN66145_c5_g5_i2.p2 TRINITY_DN66145_c5_g5~~TRINITY_DN66145_c5_g5_i2.p2  ORF type:complete len:209 (-),score=117.66 TRINITY_DN66145_c5_g5_i2:143-769(-)